MKKFKMFGGKLRKKETVPDQRRFFVAIDVANYRPVEFMYTKQWSSFLNNAVKTMSDMIRVAAPDDLNDGFLDSFIETHYQNMLASAWDQHASHKGVILHHGHVLSGELARVSGFLQSIAEDMADLEARKKELLCKTGQAHPPVDKADKTETTNDTMKEDQNV